MDDPVRGYALLTLTHNEDDIKAMKFSQAETPRLLLDVQKLQRNVDAMAARAKALGVTLRPHLKTPKSLKVAHVAVPDTSSPITVSTLREAEYFAAGGYTNILCAAATTPNKLIHADKIQRETSARIMLVTDSAAMVKALGARASDLDASFECLIEVDSGEHRSGVLPASPELIHVADALKQASGFTLAGVMTHAGHSYTTNDEDEQTAIAETERAAVVESADALRSAGHECAIVSAGSTPTVLHAKHMDGVTEMRAGVYLFGDLAQVSLNSCVIDDIAVSVLGSVIGHNRAGNSLVLDTGALALSKDSGANRFMPDAKYGYVCDAQTCAPYPGLSVETVYQEHGIVPVPDASWFEKLPLSSQVRILPNHSCMTCAAYEVYDVVRGGEIVEQWPRVNGW